MITRILLSTSFVAFILGTAAPAYSTVIPLPATSSGRYFDAGSFIAGQYGTGWHSGVPGEARSFFSFDLTGVTGTIVAATLHLETNASFGGYTSADPTETFTIFDVSTALATLTGGAGGVTGFTDLGTGVQFGSVVVDNSVGQFIDVILNPAGLAYLNGLGGGIGIFGGAVTTLAKGAAPANEILFNGTSATQTRQILLQTVAGTGVPEPATWIMTAVGMLFVVAATARKR